MARPCRRRSWSSRSSARSPRARAACSRATCSSRACGATRPIATHARSTSTSATCARSSRRTPRSPSTSSRCAASATASATRSSRVRVRSLRNRLALIIGLIVLCAIAIIYFAVAPQLEGRLRNQKLDNLAADARRYSPPLRRLVGTDAPQPELAREVRLVATRASAEVNVLGIVKGTEDSLFVLADSDAGGVEVDDVKAVAQAALGTGRTARTTEPTRLGRQALVAEPLIAGGEVRGVAVYADALTDVQANVGLIRRRILVAGGIAFLLAVLGGYLVARALSLRVKRLERAARKVAGGDFSDRIQPDSDDELGELGAAFDDMQRQLQRLDHARKQFIAQASHELRTPLFSLGGFLELLEDEELDEETRKAFIRQVRQQTLRLQKLATDLLDLSRLEAGSLELRTEPTDVGSLTRAVVAEFAPAIAASRSEERRVGKECRSR